MIKARSLSRLSPDPDAMTTSATHSSGSLRCFTASQLQIASPRPSRVGGEATKYNLNFDKVVSTGNPPNDFVPQRVMPASRPVVVQCVASLRAILDVENQAPTRVTRSNGPAVHPPVVQKRRCCRTFRLPGWGGRGKLTARESDACDLSPAESVGDTSSPFEPQLCNATPRPARPGGFR